MIDLQVFLINSVLFFIPSLLLTLLATVIVTRSYHLKEANLSALCMYAFGLANFFEGIRHMMAVEYSAAIHIGIVIPLMLTGLAFAVHLQFVHTSHFKVNRKLIVPLSFYIILAILFVSLLVLSQTTAFTYSRSNGWYYVNEWSVQILFYLGFAIYVAIIFFFTVQSVIYSPRRMKKFILTNTILLAIAVLVFIVVVWRFNKLLPPEPLVTLVGPVAGGLIGISVLFFNFTPSVAKRYQLLMDLSPNAVMLITSHLKVVEVNQYANELLNLKPDVSLQALFHHPENQKSLQQFIQLLRQENQVKFHTFPYIMPNNTFRYYMLEGAVIDLNHHQHMYVIIHDVTKEYEQQSYMKFLAYHDVLTKLHNRAYFIEQFNEVLNAKKPGVLVLSDLNFFKQINDLHGHAVGDEVLKHTAMLLKQTLAEDVLCARLGGDEFILYFSNTTEVAFRPHLQQLRDVFHKTPYVRGDLVIKVIPSFGYTVIQPDAYASFEKLYQEADMSMYRDKKRVKANYSG